LQNTLSACRADPEGGGSVTIKLPARYSNIKREPAQYTGMDEVKPVWNEVKNVRNKAEAIEVSKRAMEDASRSGNLAASAAAAHKPNGTAARVRGD
jgi:hypothetical protein